MVHPWVDAIAGPLAAGWLAPVPLAASPAQQMLEIMNSSGYTITEVRVAPHVGGATYGVHAVKLSRPIGPGKSDTIPLDPGKHLVSYWSGRDRIVRIAPVVVPETVAITDTVPPPGRFAQLTLVNETGEDIIGLSLGKSGSPDWEEGGSVIDTTAPVSRTRTLQFPVGEYNVTAYCKASVWYQPVRYMRQVKFEPPEHTSVSAQTIKLTYTGPSVDLTIRNTSGISICALHVYRRRAAENTWSGPPQAPIDYMPPGTYIAPDSDFRFRKIEPGRYYIQALDCKGEEIQTIMAEEVASDHTAKIGGCFPPGNVSVGEWEKMVIECLQERRTSREAGTFEHCFAKGLARAGSLVINLCIKGILQAIFGGQVLIDPDGYVYDADLGLEEKIQGATVTCDVFDEDYQSWDRWPAELYESQINPQVTGEDGYYAFFVPPGLYRVGAEADGYDSHISPDIRVIDEIVHYNIPMEGGPGSGRPVYLPMILRNSQ